jgi:DNA-directed RNA polymerase sigma subunit (sigma70/sigma32)
MTNEERDALASCPENRKYALRIAGKFCRGRPMLVREEIEGAALLGLVKAARAYDPARGANFGTCLYWEVVREVAWTIRQFDDVPAEEGKTRKRMGVRAVKSLDQEAFHDRGARPTMLRDLIPAEPEPSDLEHEDLLEWVASKLIIPRHREVFLALFTRPDCMTLADCGKAFGITKERVRQIKASALDAIHGRPDSILEKRYAARDRQKDGRA